MLSEVTLWEDGTYEIERNCVPDDHAEQILYCSVKHNGKIRHGLKKICKTRKIEVAKKELAQSIIDECTEIIRDATKKRNKFQNVLDSL